MSAVPTTRHWTVPVEVAGQRLDKWLAAQPDAPTRSQLAAAIERGLLTVDDAVAKPALRLRGGEAVRLRRRPAPATETVAAQDIPLEVLFADESVVAVNKAAGMVVHPAAGNREGTLVNAILHAYPPVDWPAGHERAGIVHRLDRDTSGVILVARTAAAHEALARQFRERTVEKEYLALVRGRVEEAGEIDAPIGRHPRDRKRMSTSARRTRTALTAYDVEECFGLATLLRVRPHTGRTHQIRVHLAARGWPIVGDRVYGAPSERALARLRRQWGPSADALAAMSRQALHASRICFEHPSGRSMALEAPLAADFAELLEALRGAPVE